MPMAISLAYGIVFATVMTLILVPVNVMIADDIGRFFRGRAHAAREVLTGDEASA